MSKQDMSWARAWLPPLMTQMVDAQFANPPADPADAALEPWPLTSPYLFGAGVPDGMARPRRVALLSFLRSYLAGRRVGQRHGV